MEKLETPAAGRSSLLPAQAQEATLLGSTDEECCEQKFCSSWTCSDPSKWVPRLAGQLVGWLVVHSLTMGSAFWGVIYDFGPY